MKALWHFFDFKTNLLTLLGWVIAVNLIVAGIGGLSSNGARSEAVFSQSQVRQIVADAADCHAEFFYTHDPQITGVGIADALRACDPFKEGTK